MDSQGFSSPAPPPVAHKSGGRSKVIETPGMLQKTAVQQPAKNSAAFTTPGEVLPTQGVENVNSQHAAVGSLKFKTPSPAPAASEQPVLVRMDVVTVVRRKPVFLCASCLLT